MHNDSFEQRVETYFNDLISNPQKLQFLTVKSSQGKEDVQIYIDLGLAKKIFGFSNIYRKHVKALKYGYVGNRKGLNGIRDIHENDGRIFRLASHAHETKKGRDIIERYSLNPSAIKLIKVVAHDPSGRRIYGFMDKEQSSVVLFDVGFY